MAPAATGAKKQKKKWSKGKGMCFLQYRYLITAIHSPRGQHTRRVALKDKAQHAVLLDKTTSEKLYKDVQSYRLVTVATLVDRLKINGSLARKCLKDLEEKGQIKPVVTHSKMKIYTRAVGASD
ncbi:ribosomal protein S25 [Xylaria venustula]|nr:ribosomal protein S25 [Xylaria venustula]